MGDSTQSKADLQSLLQEVQKQNEARVAQAESRFEAQIQSLSRKTQEPFGTMSRSPGKEPEIESNSSNQMNQYPRGNDRVDARPSEGMAPNILNWFFQYTLALMIRSQMQPIVFEPKNC